MTWSSIIPLNYHYHWLMTFYEYDIELLELWYFNFHAVLWLSSNVFSLQKSAWGVINPTPSTLDKDKEQIFDVFMNCLLEDDSHSNLVVQRTVTEVESNSVVKCGTTQKTIKLERISVLRCASTEHHPLRCNTHSKFKPLLCANIT